jgi:ribosomal protein S18 acetylase RimI-like enzyme
MNKNIEYKYTTLENFGINELLRVFNLAFNDYIVPMQLSKEQLEQKFVAEGISLENSVGVMFNNELIGFIFHFFQNSNNEIKLYNGGTGVVPKHRGKGITQKMYDFILPIVKAKSIKSVQLEVITSNISAIISYEKSGFKVLREVQCFKGSISSDEKIIPYSCAKIDNVNWNDYRNFWDFEPTWQNSIPVLINQNDKLTTYLANHNEKVVGYCVVNVSNGKLHQLAVNPVYRNKGIATLLVNKVKLEVNNSFVVLNVDLNNENAINFLTRIGLQPTVNQYEMILNLN